MITLGSCYHDKDLEILSANERSYEYVLLTELVEDEIFLMLP
ncbi:MAG: hypothetical protein ACO1G9_07070 [Bacteroidota bacterium]